MYNFIDSNFLMDQITISPIKPCFLRKPQHEDPISKETNKILYFINSFRLSTVGLSNKNYDNWYADAANLIKIFDEPSLKESEVVVTNLKELPNFIFMNIKKNATEGFKSMIGIIFNLLLKFGFVKEEVKKEIFSFLHENLGNFHENMLHSNRTNNDFDTINRMKEKEEIYNLDTFVDICKFLNEKNISVSVCDEFGKFSMIFMILIKFIVY